MPRIAVHSLFFDPDGSLMLDIKAEDAAASLSVSRRVSRTATLDGRAVIFDGGYSAADRTITVRPTADTSQADVLLLQRIFRLYPLVLLFTDDGAFLAAPQSFVASGGVISASFLVKGEGEVKVE